MVVVDVEFSEDQYSADSEGLLVTTYNSVTLRGSHVPLPQMDDIDLDDKLRELEDSFKVRRERRKEQRLVMEEELEKSIRKDLSVSRGRQIDGGNESEKIKPAANKANTLVTDQEESYVRELCQTEKRIRELENVISGLNFELEKIDLAEHTAVQIKPAEGFKVSTDI